jgi:hypothetical protein
MICCDPETIKEWFDKINEAGKKIVENCGMGHPSYFCI